MRPVALTVAGSDSGGGAGVQADLKAIEARGAFGASAVTALTAQNTTGVSDIHHVPPETVEAQISAVCDDLPVAAAKTGMLASADTVRTVADALPTIPLVVDPVVVAQSGDRLLDDAGVRAVRDALLPRATLLTPNVPEAELLADTTVEDADDMRRAGDRLRDLGADAVLVTGGHLDADPVDVLVADDATTFEHDRIDTAATHGSGCTLSAALAAELATGTPLPDAVEAATDYVVRTIERGLDLGAGAGPVNHLAPLHTDADTARTADALTDAVRAVERAAPADLIPEVGTTLAAAPHGATRPTEVVATDGRLTRTVGGVRAPAGVRRGASSHVARLLCGVRQHDPTVSAAANVRRTDAALDALDDVVFVDRTNEPADAAGTMDWTADRAMRTRERAPTAIADDGAHGKEPMIRLLADSIDALENNLLALTADAGERPR
ncbi:bifunctional hydroxymethylpyrimidine kinase/phosphomethylpyrimidine kinase [Salarchaeum sp. III]|uniref:bifunctional hydroxymethylpyrimidine kinase/phosphomethylpyrimidine kinase n=1 Tax=Salarchaeum sp. III TaxID=3107927 RepID=UPI002ED79EB5